MLYCRVNTKDGDSKKQQDFSVKHDKTKNSYKFYLRPGYDQFL